jgi:hypothetical protein
MFAGQRLSSFLIVACIVSAAPEPRAALYEPFPSADSILQTQDTSASTPQSCPVTQPPAQAFAPPSPYPSQHSAGAFWFGTEKLWVQLPTSGTWSHLPHYRPSDTAFRQKMQWWRKGYDWRADMPSKLVVTGRRLDSTAPPLVSQSNASGMGTGMDDRVFIMSGLDIPTLGCWQITGDYSGDKLTFVIWVAP